MGRQLHVWLGEKDYQKLRRVAAQECEAMTTLVRRAVRSWLAHTDLEQSASGATRSSVRPDVAGMAMSSRRSRSD